MHRLFLSVSLASALLIPATHAQTASTPNANAQAPTSAQTSAAKRAVRRRANAARRAHPALLALPMETAPATVAQTPPTAAQQSRQKAADQQLLQQQRAQSANAQHINDQQVDRAQRQQDNRQREIRIQDAPGPAQTGIVPLAGAPTAPAVNDIRIQDAPGPAETLPLRQTLPQMPSITPSQLPAPPTMPPTPASAPPV